MRDRECGYEGTRWAGAPALIVAVAVFAALATGVFDMRGASAYNQWSIDHISGNCATCHGDFRASPYVSLGDNTQWLGSLHDGHRSTMLNGDCDTCHGALRFPVILSSSSGGTGFSPIGCLGCHGRAEPGAGGMVTGTGLRQHHTRAGVATCGDAGCHADADPATVTAAAESVEPPYYFAPDVEHPHKPTEACNGNGSESQFAPPLGLDNDGDALYDVNDADCSTTSVGPAGGSSVALEGAWPNPARRGLRVAFTLSAAQPTVLKAFDVNGRRVAIQEVGSMGIGRHVVELTPTRALTPGVYVVTLTQGGRVLTAKVTMVK